ncbi:ABC transporter ATP-binding protein [Emticicia sp. C21]|uniref:ABC transporter ATP-binding protein n=1 Tax=Emticicia sp. C21 TaxID=2302915 RepID=UPI000E3494AF|nr:ABC transporter ATP-binding protein [Emticicia sp. C21]RFS15563.1 ABC transporter ATP-binding protein [Emticicia sp. C21]
MKNYLRLLSYARPLGNFVVPFLITSLLASIFGVLNFTLLIPLLRVLFDQVDARQLAEMLQPTSGFDPIKEFNFHFATFLKEYGKQGALQFVCATVATTIILSNIFKYFSVRLLEKFKSNMVANLREEVFNKAIHLHLGFFSNERKGNLISRIVTDVQEVENSIANTFSAATKEVFLFLAYIYSLFAISWNLTLFALLVIPVSGIFISTLVKKMRHNAGEGQQRLSNLISLMDEVFGGMRVVKGFVAEKFVTEKFREENQGYRRAIFSLAARREMASPFSEIMGVFVVVGILLYGGSLILSNNSSLEASEFIAYIAIFSQVMRPAKDISNAFSSAQRGLASGERVLGLIDSESLIKDVPDAIALKEFKNEVIFKDVNFSYDENIQVLKDINFSLLKGKTIALVGSSGGGKSTIADLVPRFYDPTTGEILIDGIGLKKVSQQSLRDLMGIVTQEAVLFNDNIFNNIAFGKNVSEAEVIQAAKIANAHDFIMQQAEGYHTVIGDRGTKLSGGQRQRLSIARAILQNPPILILDEATSALDTESEKLVQDALTNLMKNRTTLVIAHRLSTIQSADEILVIHKGEIIERGTHEGLLKIQDGFYKKLSLMQTL